MATDDNERRISIRVFYRTLGVTEWVGHGGVDQSGKVLYAADLNEHACNAIQEQIAAGLKSGRVSQPGDPRAIDFDWRFEDAED